MVAYLTAGSATSSSRASTSATGSAAAAPDAAWKSTPKHPETIAAAIAETIGQRVDDRAVESDGARAAVLIAPLLEEGKGRAPQARRPPRTKPAHEWSSNAHGTREARFLP